MTDLHNLLGLSPAIDWVIEQEEVSIQSVRELEAAADCRFPTALVDNWLDTGAFKVWPAKKGASGDPLFSILHPVQIEGIIEHPFLVYEDGPLSYIPIVQSGGSTLACLHPDRDPQAIVERLGGRVLASSLSDAVRRFREDPDFVQRDYEEQREKDREGWIRERAELVGELARGPSSLRREQIGNEISSLDEMIAQPFSRIRTSVLVDEAIQALGARSVADMKAVMDRLKQVDRVNADLARSIARDKLRPR